VPLAVIPSRPADAWLAFFEVSGIFRHTMKMLLSLITIAALTTSAFAAKEGWLDDLAKAKAQASSEGKRILLDFTGSDWCSWCKKLDAEVFSQQEFKDYAAKKLVLVEVDFPHGSKLPDATKKQNDALAKKYQVQGYPTIIVTSPSGNKKGQLGYMEGGPKAFIKALEKAK
jgi:thioredoxin-related protein